MPGSPADFSKMGVEMQVKGMFAGWGLRQILEGKNYKNVDIAFTFLSGFIDRCTGWMKEVPLTRVHVLYIELMLTKMRKIGYRL